MPPYAGTFAKPENALKRAVRIPAIAAAPAISPNPDREGPFFPMEAYSPSPLLSMTVRLHRKSLSMWVSLTRRFRRFTM